MHGRLLLDDIQIGILREISTAASFEASGGIWARAAHQLRTNGRLIGQWRWTARRLCRARLNVHLRRSVQGWNA